MGNPFKLYRIDHLFFGSIAALIIFFLGCTIWISYDLSSRELAQTASVNQHKLLDQLNSDIAQRMSNLEQISLSTSRDNNLLDFLYGGNSEDEFSRLQRFKQVQQELANLTYSMPIIQGLDLYMDHPLQAESFSYIQYRELSSAPLQKWYSLMQKNDFVWIGVHDIHAFQGDIPVVSFVRSLAYRNQLIGYLVLNVKANMLAQMLEGESPGANRVLLDAAGQPLLQVGNIPDPSVWAQWKNKLDSSTGIIRINEQAGKDGEMIVYSRINHSNWTLVQFTSWSSITKGSVRLAYMIGMISAAAIVSALLLALLLSRQITKPIFQLIHIMKHEQIIGNKMEIPLDYRNEFGYLFSVYRKLMNRNDELYESLELRHIQLRKAEIATLQANINPHFLYNTLDQLNWMAISQDQHNISRILELMGRMFRIGLSNGNSHITVADELRHVEAYLEIQKVRMGDALVYRIDSTEEVDGLYMPKMLLQPFVENSIVHGFNERGSGSILVTVRVREDRLVICVDDDGSGLAARRDNPRKRGGGYGIRNVRERIQANFGDSFGVELSEPEAGGTRAMLILPILRASEEAGPS
ncbi:sensor histidine kinase [Cohnella fermenti]|uniref:Sensor histidine kinase n=1 Tax=Cohnella fermenti TaxID=2565925 RepID=A0A4S4BP57_9BACL|nr:sensor histidine kinase [Cohnella fermenti]THF74324.1 sensor histidine kinase [Cohnella fermenti]